MENVTLIISHGKYSMPNEKNSGDTSHQALTKFIFFRNFNHRFSEKLIFQISLWEITW